MDLSLQLTDDYAVRNEITSQLYGVTKNWLTLAISKAPIEVQSYLQVYQLATGLVLSDVPNSPT